MDNNFGMQGGSKYTLDDFNEATGVSQSTKTSGMNFDQMGGNYGNAGGN